MVFLCDSFSELPVKELSPFVVVPPDQRIKHTHSPKISNNLADHLDDLFDLTRPQHPLQFTKPSTSIPIQSPKDDAIIFPMEDEPQMVDNVDPNELSLHSISIDDIAPFKIMHSPDDASSVSVTPQKRTWDEVDSNHGEPELPTINVSPQLQPAIEPSMLPSSPNRPALEEQEKQHITTTADDSIMGENVDKDQHGKTAVIREEDMIINTEQEQTDSQHALQEQETAENVGEKQDQLRLMAEMGNDDDIDYGDMVYEDQREEVFPHTPDLVEDSPYNEEEEEIDDFYLSSLKEIKELANQPTYLLKKTKALANLHIVAIGKIAQSTMRDMRNSTNDQSSKDLIENYYNMINDELKTFQKQYNKHVELDSALKHVRTYYKRRNKHLLSIVGEHNMVMRQIEQEEAQLAELEEKKKGFSAFDDLFDKIKQL
ncbi:MAG: hypothetical protein EXX96DRAFT_248019 [Benjaminiella poitrasii]|nr:MAG: hypothetical protein EXX96DRAFT_248019 [Benjaminiella poitrasii]